MPERQAAERFLTTAEVAQRLAIKPETVYAYVSRGLLHSIRPEGHRGSLFRRDEVEALAERGRDSRPPSGVVERIETAVTLVDGDELYYRGRDATELAVSASIESVAQLLWTGEQAEGQTFSAPEELVTMARSAVAPLPPSARLTDRLRVVIAALGSADPLRFDLSPHPVVSAAETMMSVMVDALLPQHAGRPGPGLATRLWPVLTTSSDRSGLLGSVLVLMADHGLAASTVAARVAASARAHPYAVVSAGLGAVDAQYHGAASGLAYRFLADAVSDPIGALAERLRSGNGVPGFGHRVYREKDPRAELIFSLLRESGAADPILAVVDAVTVEMARGETWPPNVDLAIAAMMHAFGMRPDAGEAVFAIGRTIGWIAHALEEYREPRLRFRPLGTYAGPRPVIERGFSPSSP